jgi:hypothetical protein
MLFPKKKSAVQWNKDLMKIAFRLEAHHLHNDC